ncbi:MAG: glutamyl-tRNA reductase [Acutalibacteraceae bacterium]|nr:glutamyl-tRNA reductase [Acutalibacteraceae bacterium]
MYCISVSYKTADINLRQKLVFSQSDCNKISLELIDNGSITQCVMLCTCNRTEVYFCGEKGSANEVIQKISNNAGIEESLLSKHLLFYYDDNAITHLFKVTSGIDSMVIGEDEILGQAKTAYLSAKENGSVSYELNMIFQAAFACAKKIKTETALSRTSVSVATLAANEVAKLSEKVKVLVIGASGKTGSTVLKNLVSHKNVSVTATLRQHNSHMEFIKNMGIEIVDYNKRYDYIKDADCIISATSSPHYTITYYDLKKHLSDNRKRLFIDLAVPPDIDNSITQLSGVSIVNIDYFEKLAYDNNSLKVNSVEVAKEMISEEVDTLKKDLIFHEFLPLLGSVKENLSDKPVEKIIYRMKAESTAEEFSAFLNILKTFKIQV